MINCSNCGNEKALLLTRQNPKGQKGNFHCEQCTGALVDNFGEALIEAIQGSVREQSHD